MKKLLAFLFGHVETDLRVSQRQLQALQSSGYFVEDVTPFLVESMSWR